MGETLENVGAFKYFQVGTYIIIYSMDDGERERDNYIKSKGQIKKYSIKHNKIYFFYIYTYMARYSLNFIFFIYFYNLDIDFFIQNMN